MNFFRRLLARLSPRRPLFGSTGVRTMGGNSLVVAIEDRSYWVQAERRSGRPPEFRVWTSDVRDITSAATVVAAPPATADAVIEVRQRLEAYFSKSRVRVTYL